MSLRKEVHAVQTKAATQEKHRATTAFVTVFGRLVSQYFQRWKEGAKYKGTAVNQKFKMRLIKLYRSKLEKAFNLWRVNRSTMVIDMQTMQFEDIGA